MLSFIFALYVFVELTLWFIISWIVLAVCYPFDKARKAVHWCSKMMCMFFWRVPPTWKQHVEGLEHIDPSKSYVITINHQSMIDIISLYFLPLNFRWVSKEEVFRIPYIGQLLIAHGDIPIQRGRASEAMAKVVEAGKMWISRGASVAIFPEGTRSKDGSIHRFKQGGFVLAKEAGVDILPVVMDGTANVLNRNKLFNWRHRLTVKVLPPIPAEQVAATEPSDMARMVQEQMCEALAEIRSNQSNK